MSQYAPEKSKKIVPFEPGAKDQRDNDDLDRSGSTIVMLLQEASKVARDNSEHAMDIARKLSDQVQAAEDREKQLEAEVRHYQDRASRAETWFLRVYKEIEDQFFNQGAAAAKNPPTSRSSAGR